MPSGFPDGIFYTVMNTYIKHILTLLLFAYIVEARDLPISMDILQYRGSDSLTECRIVYSLADTNLRYNPTLEGYIGSLNFNVVMEHDSTKEITVSEWIVDNISQHPVVLHERFLIGGRSLFVHPGNYTVHITAKDMNDSNAIAKISLPLRIKMMHGKKMYMSDMMTALRIEQLNDTSRLEWSEQLQRNGLLVIPNPSLECIGTDPTLNLYSELYGCIPGDTLDIVYTIKDAAQRAMAEIPLKKAVIGEAIVEYVSIPLLGLHSGVYTVQLTYSGILKKETVSSVKRLYIVNPEMPPELANTFSEDELFQQSEFSTYSEKRIDEEFEKSTCLANSQEQSLWSALGDLTAKQKFMFRFWKERDPNTETIVNERLEEFRKSINYSNTYFSNPQFREGWRSDRGRVMRRYGAPTQVDRKYMGTTARPYETWFYAEIQGGVYFHFVDMRDINNHILVHSTAINEPRNERWMQEYVNTDTFDAGRGEFGR